jgi:hypothetical protein
LTGARRSWRLFAIAAACLTIVTMIVLPSVSPPVSQHGAGLGVDATRGMVPTTALTDIFPSGRCTTSAEAVQAIRARLDGLGYQSWSVSSREPLPPDICVAASIDLQSKTVLLVAALRPEVRLALERVTKHLYSACLTEADAIAYVRSILDGLGESGYAMRTDGPLTYPVDREREVRSHFEAGCWMYSVTGWSNGQRTYYFVGR